MKRPSQAETQADTRIGPSLKSGLATQHERRLKPGQTLHRLWGLFMSARILLASLILAFHLGTPTVLPKWLAALDLLYLAIVLLQRMTLQPVRFSSSRHLSWLSIVGLDLLFISFIILQDDNLNVTALFVLPVLMAAALGSRSIMWFTSALASALLLFLSLFRVWHQSPTMAMVDLNALLQALLLASGLMALAWLTHHLSWRATTQEAQTLYNRTRARTQEKINHIVIDSMSDGLVVADASGLVHAINPAALQLLGLQHGNPDHACNLAHRNTWHPLLELVRQTLLEQAPTPQEIILRHENQRPIQLQIRTEQIAATGPYMPDLCLMFLQDMRAIESRLHTERLASMGRMSAAVAHEIRNPLAAITQANELLSEELNNGSQQLLTQIIKQNAQRLLTTVDDILNVTHERDAPADSSALLLDPLVQEICLGWAKQHLDEKRLKCTLLAHHEYVRFNKNHLRRLLINLLDNALRYCSSRPQAIQVASFRHSDQRIRLLVWSDGAAIEAQVQAHLFEPFYSSDSRSSGLGLFICRELCARHGASLDYARRRREQAGKMTSGNEFFMDLQSTHSCA